MEITYQHANPITGNESYLIRVHDEVYEGTPCLLIDAGDGVDLDSLLGDEEYLVAVLLTHAHLDHYQSLGDVHRDGAPILTSPATAAILPDVLREGTRHHNVQNRERLLEEVTPIEGWHSVIEETISVHPIPVGHAPGACGFLIRIHDGDELFHALATGDFTHRDTAGYPGFDPTPYLDVDALFLTAARDDAYGETLTDLVGRLAERSRDGSTTLCAVSGLTGVHLAVLLAGVDRDLDYSVPVILAGQIAKLYDALEYDHPNVESIPTYADPSECLEPGAVTLAGPEVPAEGSSRRLFASIRDDPNATLVQVQGGHTEAKTPGDARCTVQSVFLSNHPTEAVLNEVVETIAPAHVIIEHQSGRAGRSFKDQWDTYTWATGSAQEETLYKAGTITPPKWVGERTHTRVRNRTHGTMAESMDADLLASMSPPTIGRAPVELAAEGIDVDRLKARLHIRPTATSAVAAQATASGDDSGSASEPASDHTRSSARLYPTIGPQSMQTRNEAAASWEVSETTDAPCEGGLIETVHPPAPDERSPATPTDDEESTSEPDETDAPEPETEASETSDDSHEADDDAKESDMTTTASDTTTEPQNRTEQATEPTMTVTIDPVVRALASRHTSAQDQSLGEFVTTAVQRYLEASLRGEAPWDEAEHLSGEREVTLETDPIFGALLEATVADADVADVDTFVLETLADAMDLDLAETTVSFAGFNAAPALLSALTENEECPHDSQAEIVESALVAALLG